MKSDESQTPIHVTLLLLSAKPSAHSFFQVFCDLKSWKLHHAWSVDHAEEILCEKTIPLVVTDETLDADEVEQLLQAAPNVPPRVLVCTEPYREDQLFGALTLAWLSWRVKKEVGWTVDNRVSA